MPTKPKRFGEASTKAIRKQSDKARGSASERGYGKRWQRFRECYLRRNPLCLDCHPQCTPATEIHHKEKLRERPELQYEETNLVPLCKACHSKRTARGE